MLNYGYGIILSCVNREIVCNGYITQIGLFHDNMFNHFNLSCDFMEPFRILVDRAVCALPQHTTFGTEEKRTMLDVLNQTVMIGGTHQTVLNALKIYIRCLFDALNERDLSLIRHYTI